MSVVGTIQCEHDPSAGPDPLPIRAPKASRRIAQEILQTIITQDLPAGSRLPSEESMMREYAGARTSVREALRILETHGIVAIKSGPLGGPIVRDVSSADFANMGSLFFSAVGASLRELSQARVVIEPAMARLAAQTRREGLADEFRALHLRMEEVEPSELEDWFGAASDFHRIVASMSGNAVLDLMAGSLRAIYVDMLAAKSPSFSVEEGRKNVENVHRDIANSIIAGDADRAEQLMREHMQTFIEHLEHTMPEVLDERIQWR
jgi:GntR family transcriptional repressor for pyruvate dehydrogenase complex